jgi:hypothetical protein
MGDPMSNVLSSLSSVFSDVGKLLADSANGEGGSVARSLINSSLERNKSLTRITNATTIISRSFWDESIIDEPVVADLNKRIHEWLCAISCSAIQLTTLIDKQRTISDVMSPISSGIRGFKADTGAHRLGMESMALESFLDEYAATEALSDDEDPQEPSRLARENERLRRENKKLEQTLDKSIEAGKKLYSDVERHNAKYREVSTRSVAYSENRIGPMGETIEITITSPTTGHSIKVPIFIQIQPTFVPPDTAPRLIDMSLGATIWRRLTQWRAGEIRFLKDFILGCDLAARNRVILKDPRASEALRQFLSTANAKTRADVANSWHKAAGHAGTSNLANSILVFSEDTVRRAQAESGINLHDKTERERYFNTAYAILIAIIDPRHQRVTIYVNGVEGEINSSYKDFESKKSKGLDPSEFIAALTAIGNNNVSRMR